MHMHGHDARAMQRHFNKRIAFRSRQTPSHIPSPASNRTRTDGGIGIMMILHILTYAFLGWHVNVHRQSAILYVYADLICAVCESLKSNRRCPIFSEQEKKKCAYTVFCAIECGRHCVRNLLHPMWWAIVGGGGRQITLARSVIHVNVDTNGRQDAWHIRLHESSHNNLHREQFHVDGMMTMIIIY